MCAERKFVELRNAVQRDRFPSMFYGCCGEIARRNPVRGEQ